MGSPEFLMAASAMAVMVGLLRVGFGLLGLGMLVNFASRAVLLGFTAGAAVLIALGQSTTLAGIPASPTHRVPDIVAALLVNADRVHLPSLAFGACAVAATLLLNRFSRRLPGSLLALAACAAVVGVFGAARVGVATVGEVPRSLPRATLFSTTWLVDRDLVRQMVTGSLAVAALGLVEAMSIARTLARRSGDRLDANQEFVGQGLANVATGLLSGYTCSGSFTRSSVNHQSGARSPFAGVFAGLFILAGIVTFGPLIGFLPRAALAGFLMLVAWGMIDWRGIRRVLRTSRAETAILLATFSATLLFPLEFAVLSGVILSLAIHIYQSSMPMVRAVVPDDEFRHFVERPGAAACPQLAVMSVRGSLFFGAAQHVEDALAANLAENPGQHLLLLRMHGVDRCDLSGIEMLEGIVRLYRRLGGDVFLVGVRAPVMDVMRQSGFSEALGEDHYLAQEGAVELLFEEGIDPAVCIYECEHRVFAECQALEKHPYDARLPVGLSRDTHPLCHLAVAQFEEELRRHARNAVLLDVREPEEYASGHVAGARLLPLRYIIDEAPSLPKDRPIFLVCRSGRRSTRAMHWLLELGFERVCNLRGGVLSWKAAGRPLQVD
jgi:SulP family sulfate permease